MKNIKKPELLSPAGNDEKLRIALDSGADAVYVGGYIFGLRKYTDNFSEKQLQKAIDFANERHKKVYVVLNAFAHESDLDTLIPYLNFLEKIQPHGFIISDLGVWQLARQYTQIPLHVSTQASVTNAWSCQFWKDQGAKRVVLAREVSLAECEIILKTVDIELEIFIHGAMCASYSGKCVISNYTTGRDSNRGGCIQSCRHQYEQLDPDTKQGYKFSHIMNAKDLMGIAQLPHVMSSGVTSLKIEGRMKSNLYVSNTTQLYRQAIDMTYDALIKGEKNIDYSSYIHELKKVSNRGFSSGGLLERPGQSSIQQEFDRYEKSVIFIGTVKYVDAPNWIYVDLKAGFSYGDTLEWVGKNQKKTMVAKPSTVKGALLEKTKPSSVVRLEWFEGVEANSIFTMPC